MKYIFTILALLSSFYSFSQCQSAQCDITFTLPIQPNDYNNNQATHRCIIGNGTFQNNLNGGNWSSLSFNGNITIDQTININQSKRVFASGNIIFNQITFAGGQDSSNLYISDNSVVNFPNGIQAANNFYNYIFIGNNSTVTISGIQYHIGDILQLQGNNTNVVHFVSCSIPLPIVFEKFEFSNGYLSWKVNSNRTYVQLEYASTANPNDFRVDCTPRFKEDKYKVTGSGYYRLICDQDRSNIIYIDYIDIPSIDLTEDKKVIYYYNGYFSEHPFKNATYIGTKTIR